MNRLHPLVRETMQLINAHKLHARSKGMRVTTEDICVAAGYAPSTFRGFWKGRTPSIARIDDLLHAVGYKLVIVKIDAPDLSVMSGDNNRQAR